MSVQVSQPDVAIKTLKKKVKDTIKELEDSLGKHTIVVKSFLTKTLGYVNGTSLRFSPFFEDNFKFRKVETLEEILNDPNTLKHRGVIVIVQLIRIQRSEVGKRVDDKTGIEDYYLLDKKNSNTYEILYFSDNEPVSIDLELCAMIPEKVRVRKVMIPLCSNKPMRHPNDLKTLLESTLASLKEKDAKDDLVAMTAWLAGVVDDDCKSIPSEYPMGFKGVGVETNLKTQIHHVTGSEYPVNYKNLVI